ncbi:transposase (plasmid) [Arthrobacter agilis]|uniref:transposase n=1 Tax=Arthrobacter agilis TaxID=37921 RepID=UPI002365EED5|nr:transposase [Arthrobacter agilis]WDF35294.1 transposase [Arthrobacter agilis]
MSDIRRNRWDDRATRRSSDAKFSTHSLLGAASLASRSRLDVSDQTIYNWRRQDRIDRGETPGLSSAEKGELATTDRRIRELETELAISRRAVELLKEETSPTVGTRRSK